MRENRIILTPTGEYRIGICKYKFFDEYRKTLQYPEGQLIPLQIYFPLSKGEHVSQEKLYEEQAPKLFPTLINKVFAKPADPKEIAPGKHPVVIFSHGNGAIMTDYAIINEELASHGFIVICIQHQLATDPSSPKFWSNRSCSKHSHIIDNILYVFDWNKRNKEQKFLGNINSSKVALIGHSMGGNALLMLANRTSSIFRTGVSTLLPHDPNATDIKECIVFIDGELQFRYPAKYPILFCLSEERKAYQEKAGTLELLQQAGYKFHHYPGSRHISFMDHAYLNESFPDGSNKKYFNGNSNECQVFYQKLRQDILKFLNNNIIT
ncbi:MAG: hypothetical protein J0H68_05810 [Sphingobacteriia bacterium]|nr:hypothetical protein [Sphingobacteriia bacterium]